MAFGSERDNHLFEEIVRMYLLPDSLPRGLVVLLVDGAVLAVAVSLGLPAAWVAGGVVTKELAGGLAMVMFRNPGRGGEN